MLQRISSLDTQAAAKAHEHWLKVAKPLLSLGKLERAVEQIAGIRGTECFPLQKKGLVIMCADNGVVAEGVTQCGQDITAAVSANFAKGSTSVCIMSQIAGVDVYPIDIGVAVDIPGVTVPEFKVMYGTENMVKGPAMSEKAVRQAIAVGIFVVDRLKKSGYDILATGEMGIGNTTTSSAVAAVLLGKNVKEVTGKGAGLSSAGLQSKIRAIERALTVNQPDCHNPLDVVAKVGGLDIAGLMGVFIGGAVYRLPVVIDGFISATAALAAVRLCPLVRDYILPSHVSNEPAGRLILEALELEPFINCGMFLGEGTGAVTFLPLLDMAYGVYREMNTFDKLGYEAYEILS